MSEHLIARGAARKFELALLVGVAVVLGSATGCRESGQPVIAEFEPNLVFAHNMAARTEQPFDIPLEQAGAALDELFGTPDEPKLPKFIVDDPDLGELISLDRLKRAAGPADQAGAGLYRKHCATCHGVTGNGRGPTAALVNPYPRDYRMGRFKFKSTPIGSKPTKEDIARAIKYGLPGSSMVPIPELTDEDIADLTDYVIYLSWRGELERSLLLEAGELFFEDGESLYDPTLKESDPEYFEDQVAILEDYTFEIAEAWFDAELDIYETPERDKTIVPDTFEEVLAAAASADDSPVKQSLERGQALFVSEKTTCAKCHGKQGRGDGQANDYDEWTNDWTKKFGIDPTNEEEQIPLIARGALPVRKVAPRSFVPGVYRGGQSPEDLFTRIKLGIEGTPMPAAASTVTDEEIWDLVNYVRSLYEPEPEVGQSADPAGESVAMHKSF